jgi:hypothetical protein
VQWCAQVAAHDPIPPKDQRLEQAIEYRVLPPEHTRRLDKTPSAALGDRQTPKRNPFFSS